MTLREALAIEFVMVFRAVEAVYGRRSYTDFRIKAARRRYRQASAA